MAYSHLRQHSTETSVARRNQRVRAIVTEHHYLSALHQGYRSELPGGPLSSPDGIATLSPASSSSLSDSEAADSPFEGLAPMPRIQERRNAIDHGRFHSPVQNQPLEIQGLTTAFASLSVTERAGSDASQYGHAQSLTNSAARQAVLRHDEVDLDASATRSLSSINSDARGVAKIVDVNLSGLGISFESPEPCRPVSLPPIYLDTEGTLPLASHPTRSSLYSRPLTASALSDIEDRSSSATSSFDIKEPDNQLDACQTIDERVDSARDSNVSLTQASTITRDSSSVSASSYTTDNSRGAEGQQTTTLGSLHHSNIRSRFSRWSSFTFSSSSTTSVKEKKAKRVLLRRRLGLFVKALCCACNSETSPMSIGYPTNVCTPWWFVDRSGGVVSIEDGFNPALGGCRNIISSIVQGS